MLERYSSVVVVSMSLYDDTGDCQHKEALVDTKGLAQGCDWLEGPLGSIDRDEPSQSDEHGANGMMMGGKTHLNCNPTPYC